MASRLQVAQHLSDHLGSGRRDAVRSAAAWLVSTGRQRQAEYLAKDVAALLAARGHVLVNVTTARPVSRDARQSIDAYVRQATGAQELELNLIVDPALIGGVVIETPQAVLDASVRTKLARYVEGVIK